MAPWAKCSGHVHPGRDPGADQGQVRQIISLSWPGNTLGLPWRNWWNWLMRGKCDAAAGHNGPPCHNTLNFGFTFVLSATPVMHKGMQLAAHPYSRQYTHKNKMSCLMWHQHTRQYFIAHWQDQGEAEYWHTSTLTPPKHLHSRNINRVCWCPINMTRI